MRKRKLLICFIFFLVLFWSGCTDQDTMALKIVVMGNPDTFYPGYRQGMERAIKELNDEYEGRSCSIELEFCGGGSYAEGAAIIDTLTADKSVTAVIGARDMELNKIAAELCEQKKKLLVIPYFLNDSVYEDNHYNLVFSTSNSGDYVGRVLRSAAKASGKLRWAVCAGNSEFEIDETSGFLRNGADDKIQIIDCVNITELKANFDETYQRWETLGVEGVVMFPGDNDCFELLKKLKRKNPELVCGGDSSFDDSDLLNSDEELQSAMDGFIMVLEFVTKKTAEAEIPRIDAIIEEYMSQTDARHLDIWFYQGYNAVRMICDTAIENQTDDPEEIAQLLHKNGYSGLRHDFIFHDNGMLNDVVGQQYIVFNANGYTAINAEKNQVDFVLEKE